MKQLTGLDGSFLYMETATSFGHVSGLAIYQRPNAAFDPYEAVYRRFASKVGAIEPLRRRIVEVPLELDHPYWIDDPNFDLDFHIRHLSLAPPGRVDQLAEQVARIVGRPMDRTRPLWEVYVIEGLESGRWALLTKYHHATIDGASGVLMLNLLNDHTPDAPHPGESPPWTPEPIPSEMELLRLTLANLIRNPAKAAHVELRIIRELAEAARRDQREHGRRAHAGRRSATWWRRETDHACRCPSRRRRRPPGTSRSPPTAASPSGRRRSPTSSASRTPPGGRSTTWSWRCAPVRCARTWMATDACRTGRCGRWFPSRSGPARRPSRGRTGSRD